MIKCDDPFPDAGIIERICFVRIVLFRSEITEDLNAVAGPRSIRIRGAFRISAAEESGEEQFISLLFQRETVRTELIFPTEFQNGIPFQRNLFLF